jgi:hypothetical protein
MKSSGSSDDSIIVIDGVFKKMDHNMILVLVVEGNSVFEDGDIRIVLSLKKVEVKLQYYYE